MFLEHKECPVCQKDTAHHNGACSECAERRNREYLHKWNCMSYDDRLKDLRERVERLERGEPTY